MIVRIETSGLSTDSPFNRKLGYYLLKYFCDLSSLNMFITWVNCLSLVHFYPPVLHSCNLEWKRSSYLL